MKTLEEMKQAGIDVEQAMNSAHELKGIVGNLALIEVYHSLYDIVETLRGGNLPKEESLSAFISIYQTCFFNVKEV